MNVLDIHSWYVSIEQATELQRELRSRITVSAVDLDKVRYVAGVDVSFSRGSNLIFAAIVVLTYPALDFVEVKTAAKETSFPYIPGYLSFREGPAVLEGFKKIEQEPDVVIFDGQGIAHPRGLGIASHLGLFIDKPSIGSAKSVLVGKYEEPDIGRGSTSPLMKDGVQVGVALRTRAGVSPVFVSVGNKIDIAGAVEVILTSAPRYRIPEPIRKAHSFSNEVRTGRLR